MCNVSAGQRESEEETDSERVRMTGPSMSICPEAAVVVIIERRDIA